MTANRWNNDNTKKKTQEWENKMKKRQHDVNTMSRFHGYHLE
jgi:hypothetical protein